MTSFFAMGSEMVPQLRKIKKMKFFTFFSFSLNSTSTLSSSLLSIQSSTRSSSPSSSSAAVAAALAIASSTASPSLSSFLSSTMTTNDMEVTVQDDCRFRPTFENYVTIVSFCIIFCLSVVGNAVVVAVILQVCC